MIQKRITQILRRPLIKLQIELYHFHVFPRYDNDGFGWTYGVSIFQGCFGSEQERPSAMQHRESESKPAA